MTRSILLFTNLRDTIILNGFLQLFRSFNWWFNKINVGNLIYNIMTHIVYI